MVIKNITIKNVLKSKLTYIFILVLIFIFIFFSFILRKIDGYIFGVKINDIVGNNKINSKLLKMTSYYSEMDVTIISKNINTYRIKEWNKGENYRFEFLDAYKNKVVIVINGKTTYILNEGEKSKLKLENYLNKETNLLSINTFLNIYKNIDKKQDNIYCGCRCELREKENDIIIKIEGKKQENLKCKVETLLNELNLDRIKIELEIDKKTGLPTQYIVYNENNEQSIVGIYNVFKINEKIEDSVFEI